MEDESTLPYNLNNEEANLYNMNQNFDLMNVLNKTLDDDIFNDRK